jgi:hypothetical protein
MPINQVLLSNTFNEFRVTVNDIANTVNDLTANVLSGDIVASTITVGQVSSNLVPSSNVTYNIGSSTNRWKDLYLSGNTIFLGAAEIKFANNELSFTVGGNTIPIGGSSANIDAANITSGTLSSDRLPTSGVTAGTYGSSSAIPVLVVDAKGRITGASTQSVAGVSKFSYFNGNTTLSIETGAGTTYNASIGASSSNGASTIVTRDAAGSFAANIITATTINAATSANNLTTGYVPGDRGVTSGAAFSSFVEYNGTTATAGQFDGGSTVPSATTRLNYGGYLYATRFYGDGSQLTGIVASTATTATNIAGGAANRLVVQSGSGSTTFVVAPTFSNSFLTWNGSAFAFANGVAGVDETARTLAVLAL